MVWANGVDVVLPHDSAFNVFVFHTMMEQGGTLQHSRCAGEGGLPSRRGVAATSHLRTSKGDVHVFQSNSRFALLPVTMSTLSCQISYVNATHFGTAYPDLLFWRRALLAHMCRSRSLSVSSYVYRKFSIRLFVNHWEDRAEEGQCAAEYFECPAQVRTFTDPGSLWGRMRPLQSPPLRQRLAWRLDVRPCGGRCFVDAYIIERWHVVARVY